MEIKYDEKISGIASYLLKANPEAGTDVWKGGMATFFHKGTNGRWRDVLSAAEVAMYEETAVKVLTPECKRWLEQRRMAPGLNLRDSQNAGKFCGLD